MEFNSSNITRGQAACILLSKEYNEKECLEQIENNPLEMYICHYGDPHHLLLIPTVYVNQHPSHYHQYPSIVESTRSSTVDANKDRSRESTPEHALLYGDRDLIAFLNTVFRCESPDKDDERRYNYESLTINEIYTQILNYTLRFRKVEDESSTFTYWAKKAMPDFMSVVVKRRRIRDEQIDAIVNQMVIHKANLKTWKEQGCVVIGYARKSTIPHVKDDVRGICFNSIEPIASRDTIVNKDIISSLHQCSGDTQDMIKYIRLKKAAVVIIYLTYAGFSQSIFLPSLIQYLLFHLDQWVKRPRSVYSFDFSKFDFRLCFLFVDLMPSVLRVHGGVFSFPFRCMYLLPKDFSDIVINHETGLQLPISASIHPDCIQTLSKTQTRLPCSTAYKFDPDSQRLKPKLAADMDIHPTLAKRFLRLVRQG
ncbi:hypothetical protein G6F55_003985 [Rhizopus delemar]|uniref:Uncharacterized protein n=2 Tax=Rhizopus TaxID=4842 RepID=A0A9P6Z580_9FUNG|nr:hypothetical protein G6F55_003985 [Rhizopus delemar]KAG1546709.1 hypothetical protein G6F51_004715 [Rhizopus arrhizus]KAG1498959.1 hypothetical protein G6F54_004718 [Rhizopus delemar]KAG1512783.1 hypothetical protein G6F53_004920 [Rhizopus delemar]KAG1524999.1 hypothetical protein G6F52_003714 [Rhizopus delemar]